MGAEKQRWLRLVQQCQLQSSLAEFTTICQLEIQSFRSCMYYGWELRPMRMFREVALQKSNYTLNNSNDIPKAELIFVSLCQICIKVKHQYWTSMERRDLWRILMLLQMMWGKVRIYLFSYFSN